MCHLKLSRPKTNKDPNSTEFNQKLFLLNIGTRSLTAIPNAVTPPIKLWFPPCVETKKIIQLVKLGTRTAVLVRSFNEKAQLITSESIGITPQKSEVFWSLWKKDGTCFVDVTANYQTPSLCTKLPSPLTCSKVKWSLPNNFDLREGSVFFVRVNWNDPKIWPISATLIDKDGQKTTLSLPRGPFFQIDGPWKVVKCFGGCSHYKELYLAVLSGQYYLIAYDWAIDDHVRGIYRLQDNQWIKQVSISKAARDFKSDGVCGIAWSEHVFGSDAPAHASWVNVCKTGATTP